MIFDNWTFFFLGLIAGSILGSIIGTIGTRRNIKNKRTGGKK